MRRKNEENMEFKICEIINAKRSGIVFREDFYRLGSYRQISRVLNKLIDSKVLAKIGRGIYAKAYASKYTDFPLLKNGFELAVREALDRLGVAWESGTIEAAYNRGETQQVPIGCSIRLKSRCRRKLSYGGMGVKFEGNINAR